MPEVVYEGGGGVTVTAVCPKCGFENEADPRFCAAARPS